MKWRMAEILRVLDECAKSFTFPVLDNGYVYLAATRLSLYQSIEDWAMVIEVFGFSPRSGIPDTHIYTFSSRVYNRKGSSDFVSKVAFDNYIRNNQHNESRFIYPLDNDDWIDKNDPESVCESPFELRGKIFQSYPIERYADFDITLEGAHPRVFEFCRLLAAEKNDFVLATEEERRSNILPSMSILLQIDEWCHPDIVNGQLPSEVESFRQLASVLETGDIKRYSPTLKPNTHWSNWPEGGTL